MGSIRCYRLGTDTRWPWPNPDNEEIKRLKARLAEYSGSPEDVNAVVDAAREIIEAIEKMKSGDIKVKSEGWLDLLLTRDRLAALVIDARTENG
jgi:hypothetical protein